MYKVLLIDDEKPVHLAIRALVDWIAIDAAEPVSAYNGREGLQMMETLRPDIVFVDMSMPLVDGRDFLEEASEAYPHSQYIVISGFDDFQYARAAIRFNVVDYLLKPIDHQELEMALKKALLRLKADDAQQAKTSVGVVDAVREYVDGHAQEGISAQALAERFCLSVPEMDYLFAAQYGYPLETYLQKTREELLQRLSAGKKTSPWEDHP